MQLDLWIVTYKLINRCYFSCFLGVCLKPRSHDPLLRIRFLLVPKIGLCEHIKNDLPTHGSVTLKKAIEIEHVLFHPTLFLKDERSRQILHYILCSFWRQIEDSLSVLKNRSCEHITNDLPTFSPQKRNLEIGQSERLLPIFGTKNRILKIGSCERAFILSSLSFYFDIMQPP